MDTVALIRRSLRRLLRVPAFTAVCVLTLAVGIGAATSIFSIVDGVLLTPLPYPESERLVGLWHSAPAFGFDKLSQSPGTYLLYRQRSRSFEDVALYRFTQVNATGDGAPERLPAGLITPSLFPVLRVKPSLGRAFVAEEGRPGAAPVVLLSNQLWRRRFAADPRVLGRPIRIDGVPCEIVGVMPAGFEFPRVETELWLPLEIDPAQAAFGAFGPSGVARLRPETTPAAAQTELDRLLLAGLSSSSEEAARGLIRGGLRARVHPLRDDVVGDVGRTLWILLGAVGFILLIACANVSNLLIVRGEERRRETAIHTALGVSPRQLIGSVLLESLLLAAAAGVLGLLLTAAGLRLLLKLAPPGLPRVEEIGIDGRVLLFAAAAAVLSSLLAGSFPALRSLLKGDLALELKAGGTRTTSGHAQQRMRRFLIGLQVGLALVLLTGSGLMLRSFLRLSQLDPGFATKDVLTFQLSLPEQDFPDDVAAAGFLDRVVERLRGLPGVRSAGVASTLPLSGSNQSSGHVIQDRPLPRGAPPPVLWFGYAGEGYFEALGIPLLAGRTLTRADQETRASVTVVNQAVARHFWPRGDALGKRLRPAAAEEGGSEPWYTIVGIVGDVRNRDLVRAPDEIVYYPLRGQGDDVWTVRQANVVLRTRVAPESLASEVRSAVGSVNPNVPVSGVRSMEQILRRSQARMIFSVLMFVLATAVAMVLTAVGIYSFVSYVVSQRTAEFGVRIALGARARDLRWLILRESLAIALAGGLVGLLGALALTRWLGSLLFETSPLDPLTFILMPLLLLALVLLSSGLPAERAARVDPVKALQFS